jgi:hypothetical protein
MTENIKQLREGSAMRKVKYIKPQVVGGSSVHPC